jgi:hypothetical protein
MGTWHREERLRARIEFAKLDGSGNALCCGVQCGQGELPTVTKAITD